MRDFLKALGYFLAMLIFVGSAVLVSRWLGGPPEEPEEPKAAPEPIEAVKEPEKAAEEPKEDATYTIPVFREIELNLFEKQVNSVRAENGLSVLKVTDCLRGAAAVRAVEVAENWSHTRPDGRRSADGLWCDAYWRGENLAVDFFVAEDVVDAWLESETHRKILLHKKAKYMGIVMIGKTIALEFSD